MSDQDTIFQEGTPKSTDQSQQGSPAAGANAEVKSQLQLPDGVDEWIGEGRKYKDPLEALSSIPHKETHISKLEQENQTLREQVSQAKKMEDLVEEFRKAQSTSNQGTQTTQTVTPTKELPDIQKLVEEAIEQRSMKETLSRNGKAVADRLLAEYGDKAQELFQKKAQDLNLPVTELHALARRSPQATLTLFGLTEGRQAQPKIEPSNNPRVQGNTETPYKSVMASGTTKDLLEGWRRSKETANKRLGVN